MVVTVVVVVVAVAVAVDMSPYIKRLMTRY